MIMKDWACYLAGILHDHVTGGRGLGARLIGPEVTELLPELTLAQQWDLTVTEVARNVHAHPTLGEAVKEAIHGLAGHMINM
jgi:dihydrolipoamide dehydrogenase